MSAARRPRRRSELARFGDHLAANWQVWALFVLAAVWIAWFAVRVRVYFVMPDELRYVEQAVSWGTGHPVLPGTEHWSTWSQLQPMLMAPLWGQLASLTAYRATHVLNAVVFASAVFPAYLLGRRVLDSHRWALAGAALAVAVPWTVLTGVMMTENAAYPAALWAVLAVQRAAVEPSRRADLVAMGALMLAFLARTQLIVLWGALPIAVAAQRLRYPARPDEPMAERVLEALRRHWVIFGAAGVAVIVALADIHVLLGDAPRGGILAGGTFSYGREMLAYVAVGIGMLPLALSLGWMAATLGRPLSAERHAYAVILLAVGLPLVVLVAGASRSLIAVGPVELGINDRYLFYLAPLLIVGMLALLLERRALSLAVLGGGLAAGWVAWGAKLALAGPTFVTPTATWHPVLNRWADELGTTSGHLAGGATVLACVALAPARRWGSPRVVTAVVVALMAASCLQQTIYARNRLEAIQPGTDYGPGRDWVDKRLPSGTTATVLLSTLGVDDQTAQATWWDVAFWNKRVSQARYLLGTRGRYLAQAFPQLLGVRPSDGRVSGLGDSQYVVRAVADRRFAFAGETRVGGPVNNLQLFAVPSPARAAWYFLSSDDTGYLPAGSTGLLRVFTAGRPGARRVRVVFGTPFGARRPGRFKIDKRGGTITGAVGVGRTASPAVELDLPPGGFEDLLVSAPVGANSPGVVVYGATASPAA